MLKRFFQTSCARNVQHCRKKQLSDFLGKDQESGLQMIKSAPTIYNVDKSASNYKGYLKAKIPKGFYYHPTQSSDTGSVNSETIPISFMSASDPRKTLPHVLKQYQDNKKASHTAPFVLTSKSTATGKKYHLEPKDIEEIQNLRLQDPENNTRKSLAAKYNVSPLFISLVSSASKERLEEMNGRLQTIKSGWTKRRQIARDDRVKRKALWTRA